MSSLDKLTIKPISRQSKLSLIEARRNKLLAAIDEQLHVAEEAQIYNFSTAHLR